MKRALFIPAAALSLLAACSDSPTSPTSVDVGGPLSAVGAGTFAGTLNTTNTPGGGHLQSGTINCVVSVSLSITCSGSGAYQINGIGNVNATATLSASYSATVDCTNKGGKLVPVKSQVTGAPVSSGSLQPDNGKITVPQLTATIPSSADFVAGATCPNGNWTKSLAPGDPTLVSFSYTLFFAGFSSPAVSIAQS